MVLGECQIEVPPSFLALFVPGGNLGLRQPSRAQAGEILARYELCEDLAQLLGEQGRAQVLAQALHATDVQSSMAAVLAGMGEIDLSAPQRAWVLTRAEEVGRWSDA